MKRRDKKLCDSSHGDGNDHDINKHTHTHSRRTPLPGIQMAILNYLNVRSINHKWDGEWRKGPLSEEDWTTNSERVSHIEKRKKKRKTEWEKNHYDVLLSLAFLLLFCEFMWLVNIHKTFYAHSFVVGMVRQPSFHDRWHVYEPVSVCMCIFFTLSLSHFFLRANAALFWFTVFLFHFYIFILTFWALS